MRTLKRTKHITAEQGRSMAKRMRIVEMRSLNNRPEMKSITFAASGTIAAGAVVNINACNIAEGAGKNERIGTRIRLWRVEIRGAASGELDRYIIQCHTTSEPTSAVFTSGKGAFILDSERNARFTEWQHRNNFNVNQEDVTNFKQIQKFRGMECIYNGNTSTSGIRNQIVFTILNRDAAVQNYNVSVRLWFTDG